MNVPNPTYTSEISKEAGAMQLTDSPNRSSPIPPDLPKMITTETATPFANEMSALHDKLEELEEQNAILQATDAGEMLKRNARQASVIKELLAENNALRSAAAGSSTSPQNSGSGSAAGTPRSRKRKLDAPHYAAGPLRDHGNDDEALEDPEQAPDAAGTVAHKKLKLTARSDAPVDGDVQALAPNDSVVPESTNAQDSSREVQTLRNENAKLKDSLKAVQNWHTVTRKETNALQMTVHNQNTALAEQSAALKLRDTLLNLREKQVDALWEEVRDRRSADRDLAKRTDELMRKTRRRMAELVGLAPDAIEELNIEDEGDHEGLDRRDDFSVAVGESAGGRAALEQGNDKDKDNNDGGSIYEDESVRGDKVERPNQQIANQVPAPAASTHGTPVVGERKALAELPPEKFRLQDEKDRKAAKEEQKKAKEALKKAKNARVAAQRVEMARDHAAKQKALAEQKVLGEQRVLTELSPDGFRVDGEKAPPKAIGGKTRTAAEIKEIREGLMRAFVQQGLAPSGRR